MYRLLEIGEVIEDGDEWYDEGAWRVNNVAGLKYVVDIPLRRLVKPAVTPAAEPVPVVSVGDRVKVLTGPWAGCTGVVTGFETEIVLSGCGQMRAMNDSRSVVELDHVRVGGRRLTVKESSVEKLRPVVPEVLYRDLAHGEPIRDGDEYLFCGSWLAGSTEPRHVGRKLERYHVRHRRPVRVQSPGWRYLDAGETVQAGDEASYGGGTRWGCSDWKVGKTVQDGGGELFRRKLPANQGG